MSREFKYDWFTPIQPDMERWVPQDSSCVVEVGSFEGRSTLWFAGWCPKSRIVCIDHFLGGADQKDLDISGLRERFNANTESIRYRLDVIAKDSWKAWLGVRTDFSDVVFVDGSHVARDVYWDLANAYRVAKYQGIIIADDYTWENQRPDCPKVAIDAFLNCFRGAVEVLERTRIMVMRKIC